MQDRGIGCRALSVKVLRGYRATGLRGVLRVFGVWGCGFEAQVQEVLA